MKRQYYLKDFGTKMHMNLGSGGYVYIRSGTIVCSFLPALHNKTITSNSGRESRTVHGQPDGVEFERNFYGVHPSVH